MNRLILVVTIIFVAAVAGWAQEGGGDRRPEDFPEGGRPGGFFRDLDPEIVAERMQVEVDIWNRFLSLTDDQETLLLELVLTHFTILTEFLSGGVRPDPESIQVLQEEKAVAIFDLLDADQQAMMQYFYAEITAEIFAVGRAGPGGGFRQQR